MRAIPLADVPAFTARELEDAKREAALAGGITREELADRLIQYGFHPGPRWAAIRDADSILSDARHARQS